MAITVSKDRIIMPDTQNFSVTPGHRVTSIVNGSGVSSYIYSIPGGGTNIPATQLAGTIPQDLSLGRTRTGTLFSSSTPSAPGGLTFTGSSDDGYWTLTLPFSITFQGTSYSTIYIGTNSYVTFGSGSTAYSALSATNPATPKIMISSGDRQGLRLWYGSEDSNNTYRIRWEGHIAASGGDINNPSMAWEMIFYNPSALSSYTRLGGAVIDIHIDINTTSSGFPAGSSSAGAGVYTSSSQLVTFSSIAKTSARYSIESSSNRFVAYNNYKHLMLDISYFDITAGPVYEYITPSHALGSMTWGLAQHNFASTSSSSWSSSSPTSIIHNGNNYADASKARRIIDLYLDYTSGSTFRYFVQVISSSQTGGGSIHQGSATSGYGPITSITHSISANAFTGYNATLSILGA